MVVFHSYVSLPEGSSQATWPWPTGDMPKRSDGTCSPDGPTGMWESLAALTGDGWNMLESTHQNGDDLGVDIGFTTLPMEFGCRLG